MILSVWFSHYSGNHLEILKFRLTTTRKTFMLDLQWRKKGLQANVGGAHSPSSSDLQQRGDHRVRNLREMQTNSSTKQADPKLNLPQLWAELWWLWHMTGSGTSRNAKHGEQNPALRKTVEILHCPWLMQSGAMNFQPLETNISGNKWINDGNKKVVKRSQCAIGQGQVGILHSSWHLLTQKPTLTTRIQTPGRTSDLEQKSLHR